MRVLVTGATGYIGGRLIPRLIEEGHKVRVMARDPERLAGRPWSDKVEIRPGNVLNPNSLDPVLENIEVAYYLIHSMGGEGDFRFKDRQAADNFVDAAKGLRHVIYLGGLLPPNASDHLASRAQVGEILRAGLPTTEFRAGPIVGSGSASFEMVRYITERIPVLLAPRGVHNAIQPIGVGDMLTYLVRALDGRGRGVVDVGADRISFAEMIRTYARVRGLSRPLVEFSPIKPGFAATWVGMLTPIPTGLAAPLLEGLGHPVVANTERAEQLFPEIYPLSYQQAVERALERKDVPTSWRSALGSDYRVERVDREGLYREQHSLLVKGAPPEKLFAAFCRLGGSRGWVVWNWAWKLRGWVDQWIGGPGLRRGRRHPTELYPGEALDVWRVEKIEPGRRLRLRAEMKVPGQAWLEFHALPAEEGCRLVLEATMEPHGVGGWLYWWSTYPFHRWGFQALARALAREACSL